MVLLRLNYTYIQVAGSSRCIPHAIIPLDTIGEIQGSLAPRHPNQYNVTQGTDAHLVPHRLAAICPPRCWSQLPHNLLNQVSLVPANPSLTSLGSASHEVWVPSHGPYAVGLCISWSPSDFGLSTTTQATPASESVHPGRWLNTNAGFCCLQNNAALLRPGCSNVYRRFRHPDSLRVCPVYPVQSANRLLLSGLASRRLAPRCTFAF